MLLPLTLVSHQQRASRSRLLRGLLIGMLSTSLVLTGCGSSANQVDPESGFVVLEDKVVVDNDLIHTSIPERYQPSYNLEGTLVPALTSDVSMPYDLISGSLMVKEGAQVEKGQVLAKLEAKLAEHELQQLAGEFVEVYVDGVQIKGTSQANDNQASSSQAGDDASQDTQSTGSATQNLGSQKPTASAKQPAPATSAPDKSADTIKSANNSSNSTQSQSQQSQRMVTANLVIKSPITGEITQIDNANQLSSAANTNTASNQSASSEKASNTSAKATNAQDTADQDTDAKDTAPDSDSAFTATTNTATSNNDKQNQVSYPVVHIDSNHELQLTGELPITTQSQLSVGRPVSFTVYDLHTEFSGQVSHIIPDTTTNTLTVRASLIPGEVNDSERLKPGMGASMRIEYGQIELGVRLPREAIHEANLVELSAKHPRPTSPLKGYVWIVEQDQSLSYNPVQVVQYFEDSDKFLVSGINNDSLVCLADLPKTAAGKTLTVE